MKKLTFLKTIFAIFAIIVMTIGLSSCGGKKANKPDCEKNNTADVVVTNNSDFLLHVDVVYNSADTNEDRTLQKGASTTYTMKVGTVYIQASGPNDYVDNYWVEENYVSETNHPGTQLTQCQIYNKSWTNTNAISGKGFNGVVKK